MDALPPSPLAVPATQTQYVYAPGDISPRQPKERELCATASHPDWLYLGGLAVLDVGAVWFGSSDLVKYSSSVPLRTTGPVVIGLTWGATVGGAWLALPKCSPEWVDSPPREGEVRANWPLALSFALLAGATAPILNGIVLGTNLPIEWSTFERAMHVVAAGVAGFGGAFLPYLLPPSTWSAAREIEHLRFGFAPPPPGLARGASASGAAPGASGVFLGYGAAF